MTIHTTEQRFHQLKETLTPQEFNSIDFLTEKSKSLKETDPELSKRIIIRIDNLKKQKAQHSKNTAKIVPEYTQKNADAIKLVTNENEQQEVKKLKIPLRNEKLGILVQINSWFLRSPFISIVLIPSLLFTFYQCFIATGRFESQAQVIVQQPDGLATMDASMMVLTGLGVSNSGVSDTELVKAYISSNDMLSYLDSKLNLREHYSQNSIDYFSRMDRDATWEDFLEFYKSHNTVMIDSNSNIVHVNSQAFDSIFAQQLAQTIVNRAEWYINSIGHQLAEAQLEFIKREHANVENMLQKAQVELLNFQQRYNLLDPMAEGLAMQQITYGLEGQISASEAELKGLLSSMSERAPQVVVAKNKLTALKAQLTKERSKLSTDTEKNIPVSEILARYTDLKVKMELALQAYTSSQVSLEKSRIEAYRQLKYLIVVEAATKPEEVKYPDIFYNITLFFILSSMFFAIGKIIIATIRELK
ncbi:lipopolysaccharide biosynthesis protein [Vibrio paracholerae]|uniref:lipopolysaccharide biosynthesis protein n=1 Tax=Vibrio paracholerae TaxID=650003 RepID=UPI002094E78C|nr:lipopolysaccharide biosynthesis protein [Vibrio paracholerae]MCO7016140.1 lipopolysaccharide biosynthesis protein [Vibrio paracholerae]